MSAADDDIQEMFPPRVGDRLRSAREAQGLSLEEIAGRTRVPSRHLATIESGDLSRLPAAPYSAGFIKSYARVVGLDEAELSRAFRDELAIRGDEQGGGMTFAPDDPSRVAPRTLAWVAAVIAVLLVVGYAVWRNAVGDSRETRAQLAAETTPPPPVEPSAAPPAPSPAAAPAIAVAAASGPVALTALAPVWLRVYDREGDRTLFMGELAQGQRFEVPASAIDPSVRTGRAESIRVTVGGADAPPLGPPETILRDVSLKPAALLGRRSADQAGLSQTRSERRARRLAAAPAEEAAPPPQDPVIPALPASGDPSLAQP